MEQVNKVTVAFTPEEFAQRGADANARYIRMTENTAIVGSKLGIIDILLNIRIERIGLTT